MTYLLAIDQGTTSSRAIAFDRHGGVLGLGQQEFRQYYPADGWVEHDPEEIWQTTLAGIRSAVEQAGGGQPAGVGITNQRETTVVWERTSGKPVYPAIVWQDRRTADVCDALRAAGHEAAVQGRTGLLIDPYFSATKLAWILDHVDGARARAEAGELAFGTIDTFLLWRLTGGAVHATDATNASRTALFDIHTQRWSEEMLALFRVPAAVLPEVRDSAAEFGHIAHGLPAAGATLGGVMGDQQAALLGQACVRPGMVKSTYGTGCFAVANTGAQAITSRHRLLTTVASRLDGQTTYALEGSIFIAGAVVQWLRDAVGLVASSAETEEIALAHGHSRGVYLVPAFTGLGAPYWDPHARGAILGLTRDSNRNDMVVAALQSVAYQTRDLLDAMAADGIDVSELRVDGGMTANQWLLQFLADILNRPVQRPGITEITALGAAALAGLQGGVYQGLEDIEALWQAAVSRQPVMSGDEREALYRGWQAAVKRVR